MGCCLSNPNHDEFQEPESLRKNNSFQEGGSKRLVNDTKIKKGEVYKQKGNKYFSNGDYDSAIKEYQRAIDQNPEDIKFYNNISACFRKKEDWNKVYHNSQRALKIDISNKKSQLFYAIGLAELSKHQQKTDLKLKKLDKAFNIFLRVSEDPQYKTQAQVYLKKASELRKFYKNQQKNEVYQNLSEYLETNLPSNLKEVPKDLKPFYSNGAEIGKELNTYIKNYTDEEIPEYFSDPIDFTIFSKPMISNTGLTYDSNILHDYFKSNGYVDPITKQKISQTTLVENKNLALLINSHPKITKWKTQQSLQNPRYINF